MKKELLPDFLKQGETARLFPVLSTTSKEGRTTSIVLACMSQVEELGATLLASLGQRVGKRASIETYTEVVFEKQSSDIKDRPDGLIVLTVGNRSWRALVEAKIELCCTNRVRDSSYGSGVVAGLHEQTDTPNLQDQ